MSINAAAPTQVPTCHPPCAQVGALRNLQELTLVDMYCSPAEYAPLAQLHPTLTALHLKNPWHLPDCLARLTALRTLSKLRELRAVCLCCTEAHLAGNAHQGIGLHLPWAVAMLQLHCLQF